MFILLLGNVGIEANKQPPPAGRRAGVGPIDNLQVLSHYVTPSADRLWRLAASHRVRVRLRLAVSDNSSGSNELLRAWAAWTEASWSLQRNSESYF